MGLSGLGGLACPTALGCSTQAADVSADVLRRALACPSGPLRATQPVSSGKGAPRVSAPGGTCSGTRATRWVTKRPIVQVWTLTLTGCVRQDLGSHRVGDSLKHYLSDGVARLMPSRKRRSKYSYYGRRDERIEEIPFSRSRENLISSIRDLKQPNLNLSFRRESILTPARVYKGTGFSFCLLILCRELDLGVLQHLLDSPKIFHFCEFLH